MSRKFQLDSAIASDIQTANADSYIDSLKMIDVKNIEPNKDNFYEMSEIETLADDIERQGLMTALVVSERNSGNYRLISGHRRLAAVKLLIESGRRKSGKVPCLIIGAKPNSETQLDLIMLNATQRKYSDADTMREYEELTRIFSELEAAGKPFKGRLRERIAEALNVSPSQIGKLDNIRHNAVPAVEKAVKSGNMSISTANEVAKLTPEKQTKIVSEKPNITHKEVKAMQKKEAAENQNNDDTDKEETDEDEAEPKIKPLRTVSHKQLMEETYRLELSCVEFMTLLDFLKNTKHKDSCIDDIYNKLCTIYSAKSS